ncbi:MAG TPA: 2,3-bisphosphoglycerate-independent phosphoglycerate mutase [Verrucomicrobiae bacterium]|nr:2,3-bisphosphoglycerate-independent phosphoglycerate mutase [Verrucomicrobiae bacterium]
MKADDVYRSLLVSNDSKLALVVLDGLGDIATESTDFRTPLEAARTPHLDALAKRSALGRMTPVAPGITPGSGPGHLGLFGYDPLEFEVGRGVIEALGLGINLKHGDVAARANFCSLDSKGIVTDRRAGRIDTEICEAQCALLAEKIDKIDDVEVIIKAGKGHRFVVVFRGKGLEGPLADTDPHREGFPIAPVKALAKTAGAAKTAKVISEFYKQVLPLLKNCKPANGFLLRGIAHQPKIQSFEERYGLKAAAIAIYPMYKGLAQLVGMKKVEGPTTVKQEIEAAVDALKAYDFVFVHVKGTDMAGEDGNFEAKVKAIEEADAALPALLDAKPTVVAITGDHSTPVPVKGHSWHPQPVMISGEIAGWDGQDRFTERTANLGSLGVFEAKYLIRFMQANARRLDKFGA